MITVKSNREIELMRIACSIVGETLNLLESRAKEGITTLHLNDIAHQYILDKGATPSFYGYNKFPKSVCISLNHELIHGIPGQRKLKSGDIVSVDVGVLYEGYHGDAARTFIVGHASEQSERIVNVTRESFFEAMKYARVGYRIYDISHAIGEYVKDNGFVVVKHYCGHGIGRKLHEEPWIPNYGDANTGVLIREGMTLAIEPMVLTSSEDVVVAKDNWTVEAKNGLPTAHYENTILITRSDPVIMTLVDA